MTRCSTPSLFLIALCFACSPGRPGSDIWQENSAKNNVTRLSAEIEQSLFDSRRTNGGPWSLSKTIELLKRDRPDLFHAEYGSEFIFQVNPDERLWFEEENHTNEIAIFSAQPFKTGLNTNYVVVPFGTIKAFLTNKPPEWATISQ